MMNAASSALPLLTVRSVAPTAALTEPRHLMNVVLTAALPGVRVGAVARLQDTHSLARIARTSADPAARQKAVAALTDAGVLAEVAARSEHKDAAVAAVGVQEQRLRFALERESREFSRGVEPLEGTRGAGQANREKQRFGALAHLKLHCVAGFALPPPVERAQQAAVRHRRPVRRARLRG